MADISKNDPNKDKLEAQNWLLDVMQKGEQGLGAEVVEITPAKAQVLLDANPNNRNVKPTKVEQYIDDMRHGRFRGDNGESIILAKTGELNDGQNRLQAIVKTGLKQLMFLSYGVERGTRHTVDLGAARTAGDMLGLKGFIYGNTIAASARRILSWRTTGSLLQTNRISTPQVIQMSEEDELLKEAGAWAHTHQKKFRAFKMPASEITTVFYLLSEKGPLEAKKFMETFRDGLYLSEGSPIGTLRNRLTIGTKLKMSNKFELIVRAWNAWLRDETPSNFLIMGNIPEIKGPKRGNKQETASTEG
jgi:hypothetical protein